MLTKQFVFTNSNSNSFIGTNSSTGYGYSPITGYLENYEALEGMYWTTEAIYIRVSDRK
jgi:hypothetical protein